MKSRLNVNKSDRLTSDAFITTHMGLRKTVFGILGVFDSTDPPFMGLGVGWGVLTLKGADNHHVCIERGGETETAKET